MDLPPPPPAYVAPGEIWPDDQGSHINAHSGGLLRHGERYYWYGEHKIAGPAGNTAQVGVHVYSSADLRHWKDEGIALAVSADPGSEIARGCIIERPKVLHNPRTNRFVMWFHLEPAGAGYLGARSGIAVADTPAGPFRFLRSLRPNAGVWPENTTPEQRRPLAPAELGRLAGLKLNGGPEPGYPSDLIYRRDFANGQMARDMTLFLDDDGRAYHVYSSEENGVLHLSELTEDYLAPAGRYVRIFPGEFREAPALVKAGGQYYLFSSGCTGWAPNPAKVAVAPTLFGPWRDLGSPCVGTPEQVATTFESQPTYILPVDPARGRFIYLGDRWRPKNPIDGRYVWLPLIFKNGRPELHWHDRWNLDTWAVQP